MSPGRGENVRIEPAAPADVEGIAALAAEIWHDHYPGIITVAQIDYMLKQRYDAALMREELARDNVWWDKLLVGDEVCGFSSYLLTADPATMKLDKLYVRTRHQRRGLGGRMIERAAEVAQRNGCLRLVLAVNKHNTSAIQSYLKHGFRVVEAVVTDIGNGFVMDDYILERPVK